MSYALDNFKYLRSLFPSDFVASLSEESYLYGLLTNEGVKQEIWRQRVNDCLELAYRCNLVDSNLEARLKSDDWEYWQATMNELRVAKYLEGILGMNSLRWHPKGQRGKVGEFEVILNNLEPLFVEVKTIFPREFEALEHRVSEKLSRYAEQVPIPSFLSVHIEVPGTKDSFSGRKFKNYLSKELSIINPDDLEQRTIILSDYKDNDTGLHLKIETLQIKPKKQERACHIGIIGGGARFIASDQYIKYSLSKAYEQRPAKNQPYLVILCCLAAFGIDEDDMLNALLGSLSIRVYRSISTDVKVPEPESFRKLNGFYHPKRNRHLSATGLYQENFVENGITEKLEIYHNPLALSPLAYSLFVGKGVRQLVTKNDREMEWIS